MKNVKEMFINLYFFTVSLRIFSVWECVGICFKYFWKNSYLLNAKSQQSVLFQSNNVFDVFIILHKLYIF